MIKQHRNKKAKDLASSRSLWKGSISFGLVNVPVLLMSAREHKDLHFTMLDSRDFSPVGYRYYNKSTGDDVTRSQIVKAYNYSSNQYVVMNEADFKKANPKATQTIDIENFVEMREIDPVFFERAYYLVPGKGGEKGYELLSEALRKSEKVAIAKMVLHTKQHLVAVIARGEYLLLEILRFAEDVKELKELEVRKAKKDSSQVEMAERLIDEMTTRWRPEVYKDTYREDIMKRVRAKVKAGKATEITQERERASEEPAQVLDLMPLLKKSLARRGPKSSSRQKPTLRSHGAHRLQKEKRLH